MKLAPLLIAVLSVPGLLRLPEAGAEVFHLEGGGRVSGQLLNEKQIPRTDYTVRTVEGVVLKIDRAQVAKREYQRPQEVEYNRVWPGFADTVADQWRLAEWCRENTLADQRELHLKRIVELDPNHEEARRALGYIRREGRWTTRGDEFERKGYVHYQGEWRTPQEIQLIEEDRQKSEAQTQWLQKLKTYREGLASTNPAEARRAILEMKDPAAILAIGKALEDESNANVRQLYLHALGNLETPQASMLLAAAYMKEPVEDLRYTCLDLLKGKRSAVDFFVGLLGDSDQVVINRAGAALGYLEDPSAIGPLIRSLVTAHKVRIKTGDPNQTSTGFDSAGNVGFSAGGSDRIVSVPSQNRDVLDALVKLTGQNYGFDLARWRNWHASERRYEHVNARRD